MKYNKTGDRCYKTVNFSELNIIVPQILLQSKNQIRVNK